MKSTIILCIVSVSLMTLLNDCFAATSINRHSITWTFDGNYTTGAFANGDPWVIGPVKITDIHPPSIIIGERVMNGSEINPDPEGDSQGYDSDMAFNSYDMSLNVALNVSAANPLLIPVDSTLVSTISHPTDNIPQIKSASVLTVLSSVPPAGSFRPPFTGTDKTIRHNESDIDYSMLGRVAPTASAPSLSSLTERFDKVWLDYRPLHYGRQLYPTDNMPGYGRDISITSGRAALLLNCSYSNTEKRDLLIRYLQWGLDLWGVLKAGSSGWVMAGGHGPGRKFPILFAGTVLHDSAMSQIGYTNNPHSPPWFGEDQTTFYLTEHEATRWIQDDGRYPNNNEHRDYPDAYYTETDWNFINPNGKIGLPEYGKYYATPFQGRWISKRIDASYRRCCHANSFPGWILAVQIMGLQSAWNHDALFDYMDRWVTWSTNSGLPTWQTFFDVGFTREMWLAYRIKAQPANPTPYPASILMLLLRPGP